MGPEERGVAAIGTKNLLRKTVDMGAEGLEDKGHNG